MLEFLKSLYVILERSVLLNDSYHSDALSPASLQAVPRPVPEWDAGLPGEEELRAESRICAPGYLQWVLLLKQPNRGHVYLTEHHWSSTSA